MNIVIFGAPGAGKGTQSALLVEKLNMFHISTGDLFRNAIKNKTDLGMKAKAYMDRGDLVPDEITVGMVEEVFDRMGDREFILDGFPRNAAQALALEKMLAEHGKDVGRAVFLKVPRELLMARLTGRRVCRNCGAVYHIDSKPPKHMGVCDECGKKDLYQRDDDKEAVIANRLEAYDKSTAPLVDYYRRAGKYVEVDGVGETGEVFQRLRLTVQG